ncbi:uncharacterized protein [Palaemon carinicauda]|uniref:uncharacterized protein n=1 Tax=Palaemon carinicauda TaxID=392227 RepID=UPI0035B57708
MIYRKTTGARIASNLVLQYESDCEYWQAVLRWCVDVLKLLCERGLALRGKDEVIGSAHNGNYLGILELLSIYDSFLAAHIKKHANKGSGHTSYLSHVISEEVIGIMAEKVMSSITDEVKTANYFSISVDSTPDISHMDQLSFTIRYVLPTTGPVERFLQFIPMLSHTGRDIATTVLDFLKEKNISVLDCRGQSYDNASNMSGKYQGTQQIIKNECSEAEYIPCMAHSINLVDTRWSARADAVAALSRAHKENIIVLEEFSSDQNQPAETRAEASGLLKAVTLLESLLQFVKDLRSQFDDFEAKAMAKCDPSDMTGKVANYADRQSQRIRKRKRHHDQLDSVRDVTLTGRDMFRVTAFLPIIDKLYAALTQRLAAYSDLREKFGFLSEISNKTNTELKAAAEKLVSSYPNDLEAGLESELLQFAHLMKSIPRGSSESAPSLGGVKAAQRQSPQLEMYKIIHRHDMVETFANVEIVLQLYLCMFVTNCTGERSFSKLKLLKNYLKTPWSRTAYLHSPC